MIDVIGRTLARMKARNAVTVPSLPALPTKLDNRKAGLKIAFMRRKEQDLADIIAYMETLKQ